MKLQIVFATGNENKVREIREIIQDPEIEVLSMKQLGIHSDPEETGTTFQENALIKARACAREIQRHPEVFLSEGSSQSASSSHGRDVSEHDPEGEAAALHLDPAVPVAVLSDDSGLVVDALDGAPGIYSARYMGRDTSYTLKMNHIMAELDQRGAEGPARSARFVCACAAVIPKGLDSHAKETEEIVVTGMMEGEIAHEIRGANGFGYDPFFWLPEYGRTSAELTDDEKNAISHRGKAFRAMINRLTQML